MAPATRWKSNISPLADRYARLEYVVPPDSAYVLSGSQAATLPGEVETRQCTMLFGRMFGVAAQIAAVGQLQERGRVVVIGFEVVGKREASDRACGQIIGGNLDVAVAAGPAGAARVADGAEDDLAGRAGVRIDDRPLVFEPGPARRCR